MTDNCLDVKAQFRYLDSQLLHNIVEKGTLVSPLGGTYKSRWTVYTGVSRSAKEYQQKKIHRLKQTTEGSLFFYNGEKANERVCAEPDSSNYVLRKTSCGTTKQKFTFGKCIILKDITQFFQR